MNINTKKLSVNKGGSLICRIEVLTSKGEPSLSEYRPSAYIKKQRSSDKVLTIFDTRIIGDTIELNLNSMKSSSLPLGSLIYVVELSKGVSKFISTNYINLEP